MGGRYLITDTQIEMLKMHADAEHATNCEKIINTITADQWIGQSINFIDDDYELLSEFHKHDDGVTGIFVITGVEIGLMISDIKCDRFTKIRNDLFDISTKRRIGNTNRPTDEHIDNIMKFFTTQGDALGNEIFDSELSENEQLEEELNEQGEQNDK